MPAAALPGIALGTGIAGSVAQGIGAATSGGGPSGLVKLPPEMEAKQIAILEQSIQDYERERTRTQAIADSLQQRSQLELDVSQGLIPKQDALAALTRQNEQIAKTFGDEVLGVVNNLSQDTVGALGFDLEKDIRQEAQRLTGQRFEEFKDPQVERELVEGRARLEEELARRLGPGYATSEAGRRALSAFDQGGTELRSRVSRETRGAEVNRLGGLASIAGATKQSQLAGRQSQMQFGELLFRGREASQDRLGQGFGISQQAQAGLGRAAQLGQSTTELGRVPFGLLQQFGSQDLSGDIRDAIESGQFGGSFSDFVSGTERRSGAAPGNSGFTQVIGQGQAGRQITYNPITGQTFNYDPLNSQSIGLAGGGRPGYLNFFPGR